MSIWGKIFFANALLQDCQSEDFEFLSDDMWTWYGIVGMIIMAIMLPFFNMANVIG